MAVLVNVFFLVPAQAHCQTRNKVKQICHVNQLLKLLNCQYSIGKKIAKQTMASSDTDDDIIICSASLIASTLYQRRQVNVRKRKRSLWARKQTIDQSQLGDRARHCQRIEMVNIDLTIQLLNSSKVVQLAMSDRQLCRATKLLNPDMVA